MWSSKPPMCGPLFCLDVRAICHSSKYSNESWRSWSQNQWHASLWRVRVARLDCIPTLGTVKPCLIVFVSINIILSLGYIILSFLIAQWPSVDVCHKQPTLAYTGRSRTFLHCLMSLADPWALARIWTAWDSASYNRWMDPWCSLAMVLSTSCWGRVFLGKKTKYFAWPFFENYKNMKTHWWIYAVLFAKTKEWKADKDLKEVTSWLTIIFILPCFLWQELVWKP